MQITVPDYYQKFSCSGAQCEDTCCSGWWDINIDRDTYQKYQHSENPTLAPLFKIALSKNTQPDADDKNNFGMMQMRPGGECHFLQADKLCAIHKHMGAQALSDTCRLYPRYLNQFGSQRENSLGISCPEAARLILFNPQTMQFTTIAPDPAIDGKLFTSYRFPLQSIGDPRQVEILNDFRAVIIAILQFRAVSLGARMMLLGFLMEDAEKIVFAEKFTHASELLPTLQSYVDMLADPARLQAQFDQIDPDIPHKLDVVKRLMDGALSRRASPRFKECLLAATEGLESKTGIATPVLYAQNHTALSRPFFQDKEYIFENYLVNQVITRLFPFTRGSYLDLYRELVGSLSVIQVLLVGIAAQNQGLNEALVLKLFQTFARNSNHNHSYLEQLIAALPAEEQTGYVNVMWMLKDSAL